MNKKIIKENTIEDDDAYDIFLGMAIIAYGITKIEFVIEDKTIKDAISNLDKITYNLDKYLKELYPESKDENFIIKLQDKVSRYLNKLN